MHEPPSQPANVRTSACLCLYMKSSGEEAQAGNTTSLSTWPVCSRPRSKSAGREGGGDDASDRRGGGGGGDATMIVTGGGRGGTSVPLWFLSISGR